MSTTPDPEGRDGSPPPASAPETDGRPDPVDPIAAFVDSMSVEALMQEALDSALAVEDESDALPAGEPAAIDLLADGAEAGRHEDVLQPGPAGDELSADAAEASPDPNDAQRDEESGLEDQPLAGPDETFEVEVSADIASGTFHPGAVMASGLINDLDRRFMAAAIRFSRRHLGLTSTNPSVGTLIVKDGVIVGRGVTALGGRPHAETQALSEAGERARGATAYVTLEPCAHHGRTPPCAEALVAAGIARVVGAAADPDDRVSGRGYAILRAAGVEVVEGVLSDQAADLMAGYLSRSSRKRPEVTLKLALSSDGMLGVAGAGQVAITGGISRAQVHLMRAQSDVILVGIGTVEADNPELNCRLPGLSDRSPARVVLDREAKLPMMSKLALSARSLPLYLAVGPEASPVRRSSLEMLGVRFLATETHDGRIALPELLEDLAGQGFSTVMVEGGAATARAFLEDDVVDRIALFQGASPVGEAGIPSPVTPETIPPGFSLVREARYGVDRYREWVRD